MTNGREWRWSQALISTHYQGNRQNTQVNCETPCEHRKTFFYWSNTGRNSQSGCEVSILGDIQNSAGQSWATCSSWSYFSSGPDPRWSLIHSVCKILWCKQQWHIWVTSLQPQLSVSDCEGGHWQLCPRKNWVFIFIQQKQKYLNRKKIIPR